MRREGVSALDRLMVLVRALEADEAARNAAETDPLMTAIGLPYPTIVGMVSDRVGLAAAFWIAPASLALAALFCFWGMAGFARDVSRLRGSP